MSKFFSKKEAKSRKQIHSNIEKQQVDPFEDLNHQLLLMTLPYILVLVIMTSVFWIYIQPPQLLLAIGFTALLLVAVFDTCLIAETHRLVGTLLIGAIIFGTLIYLGRMQIAGWYSTGVSFQEWILTAGDEVENSYFYIVTLFFGGTMFFGFVIYYFSKVLYRISFLTLVSLLPCVLYAKVMQDMNNWFLIAIAVLNVGIFMVHRAESRQCRVRAGRLSFVSSAGIYIFILFLICALLPKEQDARFYDRFEDLFLGGDTWTEMSSDFSGLGEYSGNADRYGSLGNRRLYNVYGSVPTYLKRQNFDYYDFDKDRWYSDLEIAESRISNEEWRTDHINLQLSQLQKALTKADSLNPGLLESYGMTALSEADTAADELVSLRISALNFRAIYYLSMSRVVSVESEDEEPFYATASGTFRRENSLHASDCEYTVYYYNELTSRNEWLEAGCADITVEAAADLLYESWRSLSDKDSSSAEILLDWYRQHEAAIAYGQDCEENTALISDTVKRLAEQITAGCTRDYEKAAAIQNYLRGVDYTYDLKYVAEDTSPEYFLFESKTGTCSDYATAFVLLARASGLIVRYAEGYVPEPTSIEGEYHVKDSDSHAYPEVFLPNTGWRIYEPTSGNVAVYEGEEESEGLAAVLDNLEFDYGLIFACLACGFAGIVFAVIFRVFIPVILEYFFVLRMKRSAGGTAVAAIYERLVKRAVARGVANASMLTPAEFAARLSELDADIKPLAEYLERYVYGGENVTEEEKKEALAVYRGAIKILGGNFRKRRKK